MNLENVKQEDWIVGALALLLVIALLAFPWYHIGLGPLGALDRSASSSPYAIWGILALLTSLALLAYLAIHLFSPQTNLPAINNSHHMTRLAIVGLLAFWLVIKFLAHIGSFGWGFFVIVVALIALAYFTFMEYNSAPAGATRGGAGPGGPTPPAPPPGGPGGTPGAGAPGTGAPGAGAPGAGTPGPGAPGAGSPGAGSPGTGPAPGSPPPPAPPPPGIGGSTPPPSGS